MNESTKTLSFVVVAVAICLIAWIARPKSVELDIQKQLDTNLNLGDPLTATSLEILEFDELTGETQPFKVTKINDTWSLPSHLDYPADSENQLGEVAASVMDLDVLNVNQITQDRFAEFEVIDPRKAKAGDVGVGRRVTLETETGDTLADFIIGKEVKDKPDQRFIRLPQQDAVYVVALSTDKLSTKFEDWIEDDLLKLSSFDIRKVILNNYSIDEVAGRIVPGDVVELSYDDSESKWSMAEIGDEEELETTRLNDLRTALDDLKIVDVQRKPVSLSQVLRGEENVGLGLDVGRSLAQHGFQIRNGALRSNEGEVFVTMKDGVEYTLHFGEIVFETSDAVAEDENADDESAASEGSDEPAGENRYIMVMARFDPAMIPEPELEALPGEAAESAVEEDPAAEPESGDATHQGEDVQQPDAPDSGAAPESPAPPEEESDLDFAQAELGEAQETPPAESGEGEAVAPPSDLPAAPSPDAEAAGPADLEAERARIEKENQRKIDEYEKKVEEAEAKVKELTDRFADWYYVISDEVYQKIRLSRGDIVKPKESEDPSGAAPDGSQVPSDPLEQFEQLKQGIESP